MIFDFPAHLLPLFALYPEIHYRFRGFPFSRYFLRQPEIITDVPCRLEPNQELPVLLMIKDADLFPVVLQGVNLNVQGKDTFFTHHVNFGQQMVTDRWWHHIETIKIPDRSPCIWEIAPIWRVQIKGRFRSINTDNLPGISHHPLRIIQSGHTLPKKEGWVFGDAHVHTRYTRDQIEFGAPLPAYPLLGSAQGLSFIFAADHSYDLDDKTGSYVENDPNLIRFKARNAEIDQLNAEYVDQFAIIKGFELSVSSRKNKNIHLLLLNQKDFIPGSGDSAEHWMKTQSELTIAEAVKRKNPEALAVAAHPLMKPPLLERWLLSRGSWRNEDLDCDGIWGLQIWNGGRGKDFQRGMTKWRQGLSSGKRWKILGGSDAHGNFNRYRQVGFPMLKLTESHRQIFGQVRTGVRLSAGTNEKNILQSLQAQPSLVTDGPFADLELKTTPEGAKEAIMEAISSPEFGFLKELILYGGDEGNGKEIVLERTEVHGKYTISKKIPLKKPMRYLRLEVLTEEDRMCLSNPLFIGREP